MSKNIKIILKTSLNLDMDYIKNQLKPRENKFNQLKHIIRYISINTLLNIREIILDRIRKRFYKFSFKKKRS